MNQGLKTKSLKSRAIIIIIINIIISISKLLG